MHFELTRFILQRALGFIYLIAFLIAFNQFRALCGEKGLLPASGFIKRIRFRDAPSIFFVNSSDRFTGTMAGIGVALSVAAFTGFSDAFTTPVSMAIWASLWTLYLSFVNVGQVFYGYGWESLLLEAGFLSIFLGATHSPAAAIPLWLFRWALFRLMFGAGLIKIRGDSCWRDLTCMQYHYETQPLPNPLSRSFHHLPVPIHKVAVLFNHFTELVVPFGYFFPFPICAIAAIITIIFQGILILSGNLSWLNFITIFLALSCFDDRAFQSLAPAAWSFLSGPAAGVPGFLTYALLGLVMILSIRPVLNLISGAQMMNASFEPLHLVNTYGAFGSITRPRYEVILEGTSEETLSSETRWQAYEFKAKPGAPGRPLRFVSPYHFKLDWQMWFAAMSPYWNHVWILNLIAKLLQGEPRILKLMGENPFPAQPPKYIRAEWYEYHFTTAQEKASGLWKRERVGSYLPPVSMDRPEFVAVLRRLGWIPEENENAEAA